ncbi:hypothetical protein NPIL_450261 [Nephila pilipes]|uniref:Uncharacterized protein n=1 Tax=Nephila pilipes TaxID=299642 RepID=A0A8X6N2S6_NEPPI|nr:hypothetical protein NPIL_450261 [Nephila pilipes]
MPIPFCFENRQHVDVDAAVEQSLGCTSIDAMIRHESRISFASCLVRQSCGLRPMMPVAHWAWGRAGCTFFGSAVRRAFS